MYHSLVSIDVLSTQKYFDIPVMYLKMYVCIDTFLSSERMESTKIYLMIF